jgi:hypothetical protein
MIYSSNDEFMPTLEEIFFLSNEGEEVCEVRF